MRKIILSLFLFNALSLQAQQPPPRGKEPRIKDGRQYLLDLTRRLGDTDDNTVKRELSKVFMTLRQNLPKTNTLGNLSSTIDSMAVVASEACLFASYWEDDWDDVTGLYMKMLDRPATPEEIRTAIRDAKGKPVFYPNCIVLALHPEFIIKK